LPNRAGVLAGFIVVADEICCLSGVARQLVTFF